MKTVADARNGDYVQTWFDTGAFGMNLLYGQVVGGGPILLTICWESGITQRIKRAQQSGTGFSSGVVPAKDAEAAQAAMQRRTKMLSESSPLDDKEIRRG